MRISQSECRTDCNIITCTSPKADVYVAPRLCRFPAPVCQPCGAKSINQLKNQKQGGDRSVWTRSRSHLINGALIGCFRGKKNFNPESASQQRPYHKAGWEAKSKNMMRNNSRPFSSSPHSPVLATATPAASLSTVIITDQLENSSPRKGRRGATGVTD